MSKSNRYVVGDGVSLCYDGDTFCLIEAVKAAKDIVKNELDDGEIVTIYQLIPVKYIKSVKDIVVVDVKLPK